MSFLGRALSSALNYYKDINPSTLTGAIDVIVVQRPSSEDKDGYELTCTPFHVRFGKLSVLRAAEKKVTLHLNDSEVPLEFSMKVGEAGEAFFVFETDTDVPEDLQTSPIISPIDVDVNDQLPDQLNDNQNEDLKGLNIKYGKINDEPEPLDLNGNVNENDNNINEYVNDNNDNDNDDSDHENQYQLNNSNPSIIKNVGLTATKFGNAIIGGASNIGDMRGQKLKRSRPSKVSVNEFEQDEDPSDKYLPKFDDAKAPSVVYTDDVVLDVEGYKQPEGVSVEKRKDDFEHQSQVINEALNNNEQVGDKTPEDLALATFGYDLLTSAHGENVSVANQSNNNNNNNDINKGIDDIDDDESNKINKISNIESDENDAFNVENLKNSLESLTKNAQEQTEDEYTWDWGGFPTKSTQATPRIEKPFLNFNQFNDKNSLPNNTDNDEVDQRPKLHPGENEFEFILEMKNIKHVFELSMYGHKENEDIDQNKFENNRITFGNFLEDADIIDNKGLICRYNDRYLDWFSSVPVMASLAIYRRSLNETLSVVGATSHKDDNDVAITTKPTIQQPSSGWSRWWSKSKSDTDLATTAATQAEDNQKQDQKSIKSDDNNYSNDGKQKHYVKTLRLTSDQLKSLNLRKGVNNIRFSVNSSYSGIAIATARIFYWDSSDQVVISDIDGTITKSDALGHVFTMIGRDWTHIGVAKLYTDIAQNGYQILYLTSRAIGQADTTRDYLRGIRQNHHRLPDGPVIMSPDRLMASLHREVIMRKPEVFKMAALRDIQRVFDVKNPFYAGFGNRITDAMSYRSVNVPSSRIFTIDSEGEVKMELLELAGYKSSYIHMTDLVDQMFPSINNSFEPDFTDFNYWKPSIPDVELPDLSPPSPALSAKSDQSTTSKLNMFWPSSIASSLSRRGSTATSPLSTAVNDDGKKTSSGRASRASSPSISTYSRAQSPVSDFVLSEEEEEDDDETSEDDEEDNESSYADNSSIGNKSSTVGDRSRSFDYNGDEIDDDFDEDILATREMNNVPFL